MTVAASDPATISVEFGRQSMDTTESKSVSTTAVLCESAPSSRIIPDFPRVAARKLPEESTTISLTIETQASRWYLRRSTSLRSSDVESFHSCTLPSVLRVHKDSSFFPNLRSAIEASPLTGKPATALLLAQSYMLTIPSTLPAATVRPVWLKATQLTGESRSSSFPNVKFPILEKLLEFQRERLPLRPSPLSFVDAMTAKTVSEGLHFTLMTSVSSLWISTSKTNRFESTFHPFTVPMEVPRSTSFFLRGSHSKQSTLQLHRMVTFLVLGASSALQILTVPLDEELATFSPSGEHLQQVIGASCPSKSETSSSSSAFASRVSGPFPSASASTSVAVSSESGGEGCRAGSNLLNSSPPNVFSSSFSALFTVLGLGEDASVVGVRAVGDLLSAVSSLLPPSDSASNKSVGRFSN
mmetsp:Transcript_8676/g.24781  ORF Transcript_8676/g.24781 Transcript_8676/m.24781 type:complete len:413 (+) Transcript_8676:821-2059(+)